MSLETYRKWLIGMWGAGFLIPFALILVQYGGGKYGGKFTEALGWLTALTLPTILLMIGVMVANPSTSSGKRKPVPGEDERTEAEILADREAAHATFIFRLAAGVSIVYLLIVNFVFFLEPFVIQSPQELMRESKIVLAAFDSFISLLIGYFFGKR
jgi:quinol-cytochrome oxidoreductase complex cytochrome b subunit